MSLIHPKHQSIKLTLRFIRNLSPLCSALAEHPDDLWYAVQPQGVPGREVFSQGLSLEHWVTCWCPLSLSIIFLSFYTELLLHLGRRSVSCQALILTTCPVMLSFLLAREHITLISAWKTCFIGSPVYAWIQFRLSFLSILSRSWWVNECFRVFFVTHCEPG